MHEWTKQTQGHKKATKESMCTGLIFTPRINYETLKNSPIFICTYKLLMIFCDITPIVSYLEPTCALDNYPSTNPWKNNNKWGVLAAIKYRIKSFDADPSSDKISVGRSNICFKILLFEFAKQEVERTVSASKCDFCMVIDVFLLQTREVDLVELLLAL
jgi:hypothetical protein